MPVEVCDEEGECRFDIRLEDRPEKFLRLLKDTQRQKDVHSPEFLASPLGKHYRSLKNFMEIRESFQTCQDNAFAFTQENLGGSLQRFLASASESAGYLSDLCDFRADINVLSEEQFSLVGDIDDIQKFLLERDLIQDSLVRSIEARVSFEQKFNGQDITTPSFRQSLMDDLCRGTVAVSHRRRAARQYQKRERSICSSEDRDILNGLIEQEASKISRLESPPHIMDTSAVSNDINLRINKLNSILRNYNDQKKEQLAQWQREDAEADYRGRAGQRRQMRARRARREELEAMKREAFERYRKEWGHLHQGGAGGLLHTEAVRQAAKLENLEARDARWLGFGGFEERVLKNAEEDFPLLETIDGTDASRAVAETMARTKNQVQDLLNRRKREGEESRKENLIHLLRVNPTSAGFLLMNNPGYADRFCEVAQEIARRERNHNVAETASYVVIGVGIIVATTATVGGAAPLVATIGGVVAGAAFTAGDYIYQRGQAKRHRQQQASILNAYLSGMGDEASINDMRREWEDMLENDYNAKMGLMFGIFDVMGVAPAVRGAAFLNMVRTSLDGLIVPTQKNLRLIYRISGNDAQMNMVKRLFEENPPETVGSLLNFIVELPSRGKQDALLNALSGGRAAERNLVDLIQSAPVRQLLSEEEALSLERAVSLEVGIPPVRREEIMTDQRYAPLFGMLDSTEEHGVLVEAITGMQVEGKSKDEIFEHLSNAMTKCSR